MDIDGRFRYSVRIAQAEWIRRRRQLDRSRTWQATLVVGLAVFSIVGGIIAYILGDELYPGGATLPIGTVQIAITISTLALLVEFTREASKRLEHIHVDHLLMTVPERDLLLGVVLFVYSSAMAKFVLPTLGIAIGFGLSTQSPTGALSIVVAVAGLLALAVLISINLCFAIDYVTSRSILVQRYKRRILLAAIIFVVFVWPITSELMAFELSISILGDLPFAWFVDFVLLSVPGGQAEFFRGVGAIAMLVGGVPVLTVTATALAKRVWNTMPVNSAALHRSQSLVGSGVAEHLFAGYVSRPVLTVARKRWLQERRVPRGLLIAGYMLLILPIVYLPILANGEILPISPLLFTLVVAVGTGLAFGLELLSSEYPTLPMTLTSVSGRQFIRGTILAGTTVGVPILLGVTVPLGVGSSISNIETVLFTIVGVLLCICSITLAAAIGMDIPYQKFWPTPIPFTNKVAYAGEGKGFLRIGILLTLVGLACLPALVGYLPIVSDRMASSIGVSATVVRISSLLLTAAITVVVSKASYQRAVRSYNQYVLA